MQEEKTWSQTVRSFVERVQILMYCVVFVQSVFTDRQRPDLTADYVQKKA